MYYKVTMKRTYETISLIEAESEQDAIDQMYQLELEQCNVTEHDVNVETFARVCDATGEGMNEGFCFGDGEMYFKYEKDAEDYARKIGYNGLQDAYDDEAYYYSEWEQDGE